MLKRLSLAISLACLSLPTTGCALFNRPPAPVSPPTVDAPEWARQPCQLPRIPVDEPTVGDLAQGYLERGEALVRCEEARRLNQEAHQQERQAVADWIDK